MSATALAMVIARLQADTWFADMGGISTIAVGFRGAHARITENDPEPNVVIEMKRDMQNLAHDMITIECSIFDSRSSTNRWAIAEQLRRALTTKNFYTPKLNLLRLCEVGARDGLPDRTTGRVKLVALYRGTAVWKR